METVPLSKCYEDFRDDYPNHYKLWVESINKMSHTKDQSNQQNFDEDTSWMPEFSKIISISIGFLTPDDKRHIKSFNGHNEKKLLLEFKETLEKVEKLGFDICGHNIKKFHLPFINKRMIINGITPPKILPKYDDKPWETRVIDLKELWNVGYYKSYTTLDLIMFSLGLDIKNIVETKGSIFSLYWKEKDNSKIKEISEDYISSLMDITVKINTLND